MTAVEIVGNRAPALDKIDPAQREFAVTAYLAHARDQLALAVEATGPTAVAALKAEIATAAEATKQLGLSKEIQADAQEMVRRAEYSVRKAATAAQQTGAVRSRESNLIPNARTRSADTSTSSEPLPTPRDFFATEVEYRDANAMGALDAEQFEEVLAEARETDNMSRANVADLARSKVSAPIKKKAPRKPLLETAKTRGFDLRKSMDSVLRLTDDDRYAANEKQVADALRGHLLYVAETVAAVLDQLP